MARIIQNITESRIGIWLQEATVKQKAVIGIGAATLVLIGGIGIYQLVNANERAITNQTTTSEVTVEEINGVQTTISTTTSNTDVNAVTSTYDPKTSPTYNTPTGEANVATVEVPAADENTYDYGSGGEIYEGADEGYVDPTPEPEPAYEPAPANAGGGGDLGWPDADSTGSSGKPLFGSE